MGQRHILFDFLFERVEFRGGKEFPKGDFKGVAELLDRNGTRILAFAIQYALDRALWNGGEIGQSMPRARHSARIRAAMVSWVVIGQSSK